MGFFPPTFPLPPPFLTPPAKTVCERAARGLSQGHTGDSSDCRLRRQVRQALAERALPQLSQQRDPPFLWTTWLFCSGQMPDVAPLDLATRGRHCHDHGSRSGRELRRGALTVRLQRGSWREAKLGLPGHGLGPRGSHRCVCSFYVWSWGTLTSWRVCQCLNTHSCASP